MDNNGVILRANNSMHKMAVILIVCAFVVTNNSVDKWQHLSHEHSRLPNLFNSFSSISDTEEQHTWYFVLTSSPPIQSHRKSDSCHQYRYCNVLARRNLASSVQALGRETQLLSLRSRKRTRRPSVRLCLQPNLWTESSRYQVQVLHVLDGSKGACTECFR